MPSNLATVVTNPNYNSDNTDFSSIDNVSPIVNNSFGGPRAAFDTNNYKAQARFKDFVIEFNAAQGALIGQSYMWSVNIIKIGDNNVTSSLTLPIDDLDVKRFVTDQMTHFIDKYSVRKLYLPSINELLDLQTDQPPYPWT